MSLQSNNMAFKTPVSSIDELQSLFAQLGIPADYPTTSGLPFHPEPDRLVDAGHDMFQRPVQLTPAALQAWLAMQAAAARDGITLQLISAFRSVAYQADLIKRKLASGRTLEDVLAYTAAPGFSEHHTGRAIDIGTPDSQPLETEFDGTAAYAWLTANAEDYGFLLSYPEGGTGMICYEPWHWCYHETIDAHLLDKTEFKE